METNGEEGDGKSTAEEGSEECCELEPIVDGKRQILDRKERTRVSFADGHFVKDETRICTKEC
jgi:hypothetical protein